MPTITFTGSLVGPDASGNYAIINTAPIPPGPVPPPTPPFQVLDIDWNNPQRVTTSGWGAQGYIVVRFTTGVSTQGSFAQIGGGEWNSWGSNRVAALSDTMDDFSSKLGPQAYIPSSPSPTINFTIGPNDQGMLALQPNTTYYFNVKNNLANCNCCSRNNCNMFFNLNKYF